MNNDHLAHAEILNRTQWKRGDIVRLKSGGPPMTVAHSEHVPHAGFEVTEVAWIVKDVNGEWAGGNMMKLPAEAFVKEVKALTAVDVKALVEV